MTSSGEVTQLLRRWQVGESEAREELIALVYGELRQLAADQEGEPAGR